MDWSTFVTTLTATGFASAAFVFLAKILSKHILSMNLERFKTDLVATHDKELERLRADLRIAAFQQETTFAKLHEKRAEVIAELYSRLAMVHRAMQQLLNPLQLGAPTDRTKKDDDAAEAANSFVTYYDGHQIYFDEKLCSQLKDFNQGMWNAWVSHLMNPTTGEGGIDGWDRRLKAWESLNEKAPAIRSEIEQRFRHLLGHAASDLPPYRTSDRG